MERVHLRLDALQPVRFRKSQETDRDKHRPGDQSGTPLREQNFQQNDSGCREQSQGGNGREHRKQVDAESDGTGRQQGHAFGCEVVKGKTRRVTDAEGEGGVDELGGIKIEDGRRQSQQIPGSRQQR